jgi:hypothetical protein
MRTFLAPEKFRDSEAQDGPNKDHRHRLRDGRSSISFFFLPGQAAVPVRVLKSAILKKLVTMRRRELQTDKIVVV